MSRPRLLGRLGAQARVSVVSAPAGSGKTVLLRSWISWAGLAGQAAWVAAGRGERDPLRFWLSVLAALRQTAAGSVLVREVTAAPDLDGWVITERLLADLAPLDDRVWRVVDDVHELGTDALRQLELLIMRPPGKLRFVLAGRHDVRLGLHRLAGGAPLSYELLSVASPAQVGEIGRELARFLSSLHQPETLACVAAAAGPALAPHPPPQATTDELRARLAPMLRPDQRGIVSRWCAWADDVLACRGDPVFVHGDLHGYNQVWDQQQLRLRLVADFETSGAAEAEYDFRYIPALGPGVILLISAAKHYSQRTGSPLNLGHVMAWHLRSYLGEALWRSEAGLPLLLPLPGGGTPSDYVDQLSERFDMLQIET